MPIPVRLKPDTEYIRIGDVPNLLAEARYPELPPDTPRRVTEIKKYPIDDDLRRERCGNIIPFGVTLTDADWTLLYSIWADLPPLRLPIPENDWQPYQDAFNAAHVEGWRLDVLVVNEVMDHLIKRHITADSLLNQLQGAAERHEFSPLCRVSYTPIDCSSGERFLDSWMKARDLAAFAEIRGFSVEMADRGGRVEQLWMPENGCERYTLEDAALLINAAGNRNVDKKRIREGDDMTVTALKASALSGVLPMYAPGENLRRRYGPGGADVVRTFYEEAKATDLNKWLEVHEPELAKAWAFHTGASDSSQREAERNVEPSDWKHDARAIADECFDRDTKNACRDSLKGYSERVMEVMQERGIHGPRGRINNAATIQREALHGDKWWRQKKK